MALHNRLRTTLNMAIVSYRTHTGTILILMKVVLAISRGIHFYVTFSTFGFGKGFRFT